MFKPLRWQVKHTTGTSFKSHLSHLAQQQTSLPSAYLLLGKDEWQRKCAEELLWQQLSALANRHILRWRSSQFTAAQLAEQLAARDFFSTERVLFLMDGEALTKECQRQIATYLKRPEQSLLLVITATSIASSTALYKAVDENGVIFIAETLRAREKDALIQQWLMTCAQAAGKQLSPSAALLLCRQIGSHYDLLKQELAKLITYVGTRDVIEDDDVALMTQVVPQDTIWQVGDLLLERNFQAALALCHRLLASGIALIAIIRQLRRQLQTAFEVSSMSADEIAKRHPQLKDFMIERQQRLANSYGYRSLSAAICSLDGCELSFKNGCSDEALLLDQLIIRLGSGVAPYLKLPLGAQHVL
jgi:DNA polymerase-3 subunit delta